MPGTGLVWAAIPFNEGVRAALFLKAAWVC